MKPIKVKILDLVKVKESAILNIILSSIHIESSLLKLFLSHIDVMWKVRPVSFLELMLLR